QRRPENLRREQRDDETGEYRPPLRDDGEGEPRGGGRSERTEDSNVELSGEDRRAGDAVDGDQRHEERGGGPEEGRVPRVDASSRYVACEVAVDGVVEEQEPVRVHRDRGRDDDP